MGNGSDFGINLEYAEQPSPDGLAQAFIIGEKFIDNSECAMVLGDNIFYGNGLGAKLRKAVSNAKNGESTVFGYFVNDPERFGVAEIGDDGYVLSIEEKPKNPKTNYAMTGLYFYDKTVVENAKKVKPSMRGELEITDMNNLYVEEKKLKIELLGRGNAWLDTGTMESLAEATNFVRIIENRQGIQISALEEIAYYNNWISKEQLLNAAKKYGKSTYGQYLKMVAEDKIRNI